VKLLWLCFLFLAGAVAGSGFDISWWVLLVGLLPLPFAVWPRARKIALWGSLSTIVLVCGLASSQGSDKGPGDTNIALYNNEGLLSVKAVICRETETRDTSQHLLLECREVTCGNEVIRTEGKLLVYAYRYPQYQYGDELLVTGRLKDPPLFIDDITGEVEFDYAGYLASQGIYSVMTYPEIELISSGGGNRLMAGIYKIKQKLSLSLERVLPEPDSSLICGILLGERYKIPQDIQDNFSRTGAFHLLAISGLHLGIIAALALGLGRALFGRRGYIYIFLALAIIWAYAALAGGGAPVIRAAIMATVFLVAELLGRQRNALPALALAAAIMVAVDGKIIHTVSFQMSFSAMAGIMLFYPGLRSAGRDMLERLFGDGRKRKAAGFFVTDGLAVGLAATILVLPLTLHYFGIFSPLGPIVTLLLMPALVPLVALAFPVAGIGVFWTAGAMVPAWLCSLFSSYMIEVTGWFSGAGHTYAENTYITGFWVVFYYIAVIAAYLAIKIWKRAKVEVSS